MVTPRILLSSADSPGVNNWIPPIYAQDHEKLVCLAKVVFGHEFAGDDWDVHFHLAALDIGATACTARLLPHLWNKGEYFTHDFTMTDELYIYAHFEPNAAVNAECPTFVHLDMDPMSLPFDSLFPEEEDFDKSQFATAQVENAPVPSLDLPFLYSAIAEPQEVTEKPVETYVCPSVPQVTAPIEDLWGYPPLPVDATPENYIKEREAGISDNTRDECHTSCRDIRGLVINRRQIIAKARLVVGKYGVTALKPCDSCRKRKKICRIIHPTMYTEAWWMVNKNWRENRPQACACCSLDSKTRCNAE